MRTWQAIALVLLFLALTVLGVWAWVAAPCDLYQWSKAGEIPARCVMR